MAKVKLILIVCCFVTFQVLLSTGSVRAFTVADVWEVDEITEGPFVGELGEYNTITYNVYNNSTTYSLVAFGVGLTDDVYAGLFWDDGNLIVDTREDWEGTAVEADDFEAFETGDGPDFSWVTFDDLFGTDYNYAVIFGADYEEGEGGNYTFTNPITYVSSSEKEFILPYGLGTPTSPVAAVFYNPSNNGFFISGGQTGQPLPFAPITPVPEPTTMLLLGSGLLSLLGMAGLRGERDK